MTLPALGYAEYRMLTFALKATSHLGAWLIWQTTRVSVLDDIEVPTRRK